jgi:hypothetical protein
MPLIDLRPDEIAVQSEAGSLIVRSVRAHGTLRCRIPLASEMSSTNVEVRVTDGRLVLTIRPTEVVLARAT